MTPLGLASLTGALHVVNALVSSDRTLDHIDAAMVLSHPQCCSPNIVGSCLYRRVYGMWFPQVQGWTSLFLACRQGHTEVVLALVQAGAIVEMSSVSGLVAVPRLFCFVAKHNTWLAYFRLEHCSRCLVG